MISEAAASNKYVLVFKAPGLSKKHLRFLDNFAKNKYIYMAEAGGLGNKIEEIWRDRPAVNALRDKQLVSEAIERIL
jgi:mitochondrial fission protein ELM1